MLTICVLNSFTAQARHPRIEQTDFFDLKRRPVMTSWFLPWYHETKPQTPRNLQQISLKTSSGPKLPPSPSQRGQMLRLIREHLKIGGHAFIMVLTHFQMRARPPDKPLTFYLQIPRRCLECSPLFNFRNIF